jgi:hypothetical protein
VGEGGRFPKAPGTDGVGRAVGIVLGTAVPAHEQQDVTKRLREGADPSLFEQNEGGRHMDIDSTLEAVDRMPVYRISCADGTTYTTLDGIVALKAKALVGMEVSLRFEDEDDGVLGRLKNIAPSGALPGER